MDGQSSSVIRVVQPDGCEIQRWVGEATDISTALYLAALDAENRGTWGYYEAFTLAAPTVRARIVAWCFEDEDDYRARVVSGALPELVRAPVQAMLPLGQAA